MGRKEHLNDVSGALLGSYVDSYKWRVKQDLYKHVTGDSGNFCWRIHPLTDTFTFLLRGKTVFIVVASRNATDHFLDLFLLGIGSGRCTRHSLWTPFFEGCAFSCLNLSGSSRLRDLCRWISCVLWTLSLCLSSDFSSFLSGTLSFAQSAFAAFLYSLKFTSQHYKTVLCGFVAPHHHTTGASTMPVNTHAKTYDRKTDSDQSACSLPTNHVINSAPQHAPNVLLFRIYWNFTVCLYTLSALWAITQNQIYCPNPP